MSTVETITNPKQRKGKKGTNSAQADAIYQALDSMEAHVLPLSALVQSALNVRIVTVNSPLNKKTCATVVLTVRWRC